MVQAKELLVASSKGEGGCLNRTVDDNKGGAQWAKSRGEVSITYLKPTTSANTLKITTNSSRTN